MSTPSSGRGAPGVIVGVAAVVVAVAVAAFTLGLVNLAHAGAVSVLPVTSQQTGISVCGQGMATSTPDRAQIQVGVVAFAASAEDARNQAATAMSAVLAALKSNGVADADVQTSYFSISPNYSYDGGGTHTSGYTASNNVTVLVRAVDNTGKVVDAVTQAGGNDVVVNGIQFFSGDLTQAQTEAQASALQDAHRQAQAIADAAGVSLGPAASILVGGCGTVNSPVYASAGSAGVSKGNVPTPIQPGQQQVQVYVAVVYAIR
jgi:uncharacterized protein YggE